MKKLVLLSIFAFTLLFLTQSSKAQNGDQILDGIGETSISARYLFNGNLKDWSRNNYHAKSTDTSLKFINDKKFGKVLSLSGKENSFISIPGKAISDIESLSLSGWFFMNSNEVGQFLFDFGKDAGNHLFTAPFGISQQGSFEVAIQRQNNIKSEVVSNLIPLKKWFFITLVVDISSKNMTTYLDGKPVSTKKNIINGLSEVFNQHQYNDNMLYIGKPITATVKNLNALVHDFRIYRVPLNQRQIETIYQNALSGAEGNSVNVGKTEDLLQKFPEDQSQLFNSYLAQVNNIQVSTEVGTLPHLPAFIEGTYINNLKGPKVRVIWPSPTDNTSVNKAGKYTITGSVPGTHFEPKAEITVTASQHQHIPELKLQKFPLDKVVLNNDVQGLPTRFTENRDKFINTLATTDPNSFLYMFRDAFGQQQPAGAKPLGGWDTEDTKLRGHATGHYLSAIAQAYASTAYNPTLQANFKQKMEYMVNTLYELSKLSGTAKTAGSAANADPAAIPFGDGKVEYDSDLSASGKRSDYWNWGKGFISAYPPDQFIMLENGAKYGGQKNQIWAPYYTLHKILAGLIDVYEVSGNKKALEVASNMGTWVYARLSPLPQDKLIKMWNTYIAGEFGGMNESMARLYQITGDARFLKTAQLFDNIKVFFGDTNHSGGLAKNVDTFRGLHANQHIPQIVGSMEMYSSSKNPEYFKIADNFWDKISTGYMYSIGGVAGARNPANAECFPAQPASLYQNGFSEGGQNETCATYNMLKLTQDLFLFEQRGELMDYYERGLYNHILASVAEDSPANTYHVPLRPGSVKQFGNADMTGFTCCNGTALESSTKLQQAIYYKALDNNSVYVNLFIPSTLNWTERKVTLIQSTSFPKSDQTLLTINGNGKFDVCVRVPEWATKGFVVKINGKEANYLTVPGSYIKISRTWKNGDQITLKMPFQFHLEPVMDQQNIASLFYGPVLLAAQEKEAGKTWHKISLDAKDISKSISGEPEKLEFNIDGTLFKPFYDSYGRHSVYLDVTLK